MASKVDLYEPYRAALDDDWESLKDFYGKHHHLLSYPVTAARDNAFHLAVFSKRKEPLQSLLNFSEKDFMVKYGYLEKNAYGNTPLHEAAINGNLEAVEALVNHNSNLLKEENITDENEIEFLDAENIKGETPLFKAASFGRTKVVNFLAEKSLEPATRFIEREGERKEEKYSKLKNIHYQNVRWIQIEPKPVASNVPGATATLEGTSKKELDASILHVAVTGHHFETALYLLKLDESLAKLRDLNGWTSLHLLATMPSAFKSGYRWGTWIHRVIYFCIPVAYDADDEKATSSNISKGSLIGDNQNAASCFTIRLSIGGDENATSCLNACSSSSEKSTSKISKGWLLVLGKISARLMRNIFEAKRKHYLAFKLAERLIEKDSSWAETIERQVAPTSTEFDEDEPIKVPTPAEGGYKPIPIFLATERGIVEIVNRTLEVCPQLVEHKNDLNQNILHVAIKNRQYDVFHRVNSMKIPMTRLVRKVDKDGYTILHHAADMEEKTTKIHPAGPVYQLQEEIKWYKRVEEITPSYYAMLRDKKENMTCEELFKMKHNDLLGKAQQWIKDTSQSCSAVAVLVATVVFAAAYTVPGGSNEKGYPIFLNNSLFLVFTVMDVVALACSLTSVVMFLSVLTSPYTYEEFLHRLPQKLSIGFALLFISLTTTMLAFAATLLLIVRSEKPHWTTTLIYTAAFLPVSIFALTQFPMYFAFEKTLLKLYRTLSKNGHVKKRPPPKKPASCHVHCRSSCC